MNVFMVGYCWDGIKKASGCVILAAKDGKIVYHKAFGNYEYDTTHPMQLTSILTWHQLPKYLCNGLRNEDGRAGKNRFKKAK